MLAALRWLADAAGSDIFENFPLFPFTIIGGVIVQLLAVRFHFEWAVNRRAIEGLGGIAVDLIVVCAIGTLSISALGDNIAPLVVLAIGSIVWSVFVLFILGPRLFATHWFERSVAEFGETQGNVATGFMMVDMVDPARTTDVASAYSYRQLITRPLVGGGFISAISVPFLIEVGLTAFTIVTLLLTLALGYWAFRSARSYF
jgi:ESS family glutamate:Na+ symporter